MNDDNPENQIRLTDIDSAKSKMAAEELRETARQLRELANDLSELAKMPFKPGPTTLH